MKIRMKVQISGTRNGAAWPAAGSEVELPDSEARDLVATGQAVDANDPLEVGADGLLRLDEPITGPVVIENVRTATPAHATEVLRPVAVNQPPALVGDGDEKSRVSAGAHLIGDAEKGNDKLAEVAVDGPVVPEDAISEVLIPGAGEVAVATPRSKK